MLTPRATALYYQAAKAGPQKFREDHLGPFVFDCPDHASDVDRVGGAAITARLANWKNGQAEWQRLYAEGVSMNPGCSFGELMISASARTIKDGTLIFHGYGSPLVQIALHVAKRRTLRNGACGRGDIGINPRPPFLTPTSTIGPSTVGRNARSTSANYSISPPAAAWVACFCPASRSTGGAMPM